MPNLLPLIPMLPLIGAGGILLLSLLRAFRPVKNALRTYACYAALAAVILAAIGALIIERGLPLVFTLPAWRPAWLFDAVLTWRADTVMQPLVWALVIASLSTALVDLSSAKKSPPFLVAVSLLRLSSALMVLWATNPLTLLVSWVVYDFLKTVGYIAAGGSGQVAVRGLIFDSLATLLLWGGVLLSNDSAGGEQWSSMVLDDTQATVWMLAGLLRISIYPLHISMPDEFESPFAFSSFLFLTPILGWAFWTRLVLANGGTMPGETEVLTLAALSLALGGFMAWTARSIQGSHVWSGMGINGAILLTALLADGDTTLTIIAAGNIGWALAGTVFSLGDGLRLDAGLRPEVAWSLPTLISALTLIGTPFTAGFLPVANLLQMLVVENRWPWIIAFFVGNLFLVSVLTRRLVSKSSRDPGSSWWVYEIARGIGLGLPTLLLIVIGLYPGLILRNGAIPSLGALLAKPGLIGWLLWGISFLGGVIIAWQDKNIQSRIGLWLNALYDLLRLEWVYELLGGAFERGLEMLYTIDEVLGGAGALLWSWILFLIFLLAWGNR